MELTVRRRGTARRYMADDVIKQAAAAAAAASSEDDDAYNDALSTNTARLMVSPYSGAATLNYVPRHQYLQHRYPPHQQSQLLQPGADKRWVDVTTVVGAADDDSSAGGYTVGCRGDARLALASAAGEDAAVAVTCGAVRPPVCAAHMYESPRFQ